MTTNNYQLFRRPMHFHVGRFLCLFTFLLLLSSSHALSQSSSSEGMEVDAYPLPADFSGNLTVLTPVTLEGDTLRFMTDTGGGSNMIYAAAAERLGLAYHDEVNMPMPGQEGPIPLAGMPAFDPDDAIPAPGLLPPASWQLLVIEPPFDFIESDGMLGRTWFAGRVWLFDYPAETIGQVVGLDYSAVPEEHRVELGFQVRNDGRRTAHFPRITIEVDGEEYEMLFDTGAMTIPNDEAREVIPDAGFGKHATSFIAESVFNAWQENNPDWRVIDGADEVFDMPMIEVPEVTIAGHTVGPVWFSMRPDPNFHQHMSQMMDRRVDGALGGSALKYFRIVVDYPNAVAIFELPDGGH